VKDVVLGQVIPQQGVVVLGGWIGGGVAQWVEELIFAVLERSAAAFNYLVPPGDSISDTTLELWAYEVVPAVREAIAKR
jgi:hypothetical protein